MGGSPSIDRYDDARFFTLPGVGPADPTQSVWQGAITAPEFVGTGTAKSLMGRIQMPHGYKEGTDIQVHIHWGHKNAGATANVRWILEYVWANKDGSMASTTTTGVTVAADAAGANEHLISDIVTITGSGKTISSMLMVRLTRDPGDAADTYSGSAWFIDMDAHVIYDAIGSNSIFTKN